MSKAWFTISELRAALIPTFSEALFVSLVADYPNMSPSLGRARAHAEWPMFDLEFHLSAFTHEEQVALKKFDALGPIADRISKLGIHREPLIQRIRKLGIHKGVEAL